MNASLPRSVLISGASGLLGTALRDHLATQGAEVFSLVRRPPRNSREIQWDPLAGSMVWPDGFTCDAVVHLAGANVAGGRWTTARKRTILESRIQGTRTLVAGLKNLAVPPKVLVGGSAIGFYGARQDSICNESSGRGVGFLADVCGQWEREIAAVEDLGLRVVTLRTGVVLTPKGGALAKILPVFKCGFGGPIGGGDHWMSWVSLSDWLRICGRSLADSSISGPINAVAPQAVRQRDFAKTLGRILHRPSFVRTPAWALRLIFGQMADEVLLASTRVIPGELQKLNHEFLHPSLEKALAHVLGKEFST